MYRDIEMARALEAVKAEERALRRRKARAKSRPRFARIIVRSRPRTDAAIAAATLAGIEAVVSHHQRGTPLTKTAKPAHRPTGDAAIAAATLAGIEAIMAKRRR